MTVSKIAYLTYQTLCLDLLRQFAVSFCLWTTETTNTRDTLLPNTELSVLQFFSIVFNFANFYSTKSNFFSYFYIFWNLIYILFWKLAACSFPIFDWSKTPVLLYFEKNSYMINQKSRALSDFLKITYD